MWPNPQFPTDLVTFTEEILNGNLHFLCSVIHVPLLWEIVTNTGTFLTNIYLFKVNNRNTRKMCELCLKLTIKHQNDVHLKISRYSQENTSVGAFWKKSFRVSKCQLGYVYSFQQMVARAFSNSCRLLLFLIIVVATLKFR